MGSEKETVERTISTMKVSPEENSTDSGGTDAQEKPQ